MKELRFIPAARDKISHKDFAAFFKKNVRTFLVAILFSLSLAFLYLLATDTKYTARAQVLIDPGSSTQVFREPVAGTDSPYDTARVEGQLVLLRSETIARKVVDMLHLNDAPELRGGRPSLFSRLLSSFRSSDGDNKLNDDAATLARTRAALAAVQGNMEVSRVGMSYAIDIAYTAKDAEKAAAVANAIASAYVEDHVEAASNAARQGSEWLERRLDELRGQLNAAMRDAQLFRNGQATQRDPRPTQPDDVLTSVQPPTTLSDLETRAQNYRKMYEIYLQAFTDAMQRKSFPVSNARIITPATRPLGKSHPRTSLILSFALMFGALSGFGFAFLRHSLDDSVRTRQQLEERTGVAFLASVPQLERGVRTVSSFLFASSDVSRECSFKEVSVAPFSSYTSAVKLICTAIENKKNGSRDVRTIGVTSALPGEGKTTIAGNLATAFAIKGKKVLVIDLDAHAAGLSLSLAPDAATGLFEVLEGKVALADAIYRSNKFKAAVLPIVTNELQPASYEIFASDRMAAMIAELDQEYDYIIIDMPPLSPVVEGLSIGSVFDGLVIVSEWSKTPLTLLEDLSARLREVNANIIGIVINKVDPAFARLPRRYQYYYRA